MEERRVKRFQIGDSISPTSFVPAKRKSRTNTSKQASILSRSHRMDADRRNNRFNNNKTSVNMANGSATTNDSSNSNNSIASCSHNGQSTASTAGSNGDSSDSIEPPKQPSNQFNQTDYNIESNIQIDIAKDHCESSDEINDNYLDAKNRSNSVLNKQQQQKFHSHGEDGEFCDLLNDVNNVEQSAVHDHSGNSNANNEMSSAIVFDASNASALASEQTAMTTTTAESTMTTTTTTKLPATDEQAKTPMTNSIDNNRTVADCDNTNTVNMALQTVDKVDRADNNLNTNNLSINNGLTQSVSSELDGITRNHNGIDSFVAVNVNETNDRETSTHSVVKVNGINGGDFDGETINGKNQSHESQYGNNDDHHNEEEEEDEGNGQNETNNSDIISGPKASMDTDRSLKAPLLAKNANGRRKPNDYNAIERNVSADKPRIPLNGGRKVSLNDESRPLLQQSMSYDGCASGSLQSKFRRKSCGQKAAPMRSIVKSPSTQNFSTHQGAVHDVSRKPRLSIQCTGSDPERPVLHVQFLSQQHQHDDVRDNINSLRSNILTMKQGSSSSGERTSLPSTASPDDVFVEPKAPEELIHQVPTRGILRTSRVRSSISSDSSSSSSSGSSSDDVSQFAEAKPPDGGYGWVIVFASFMVNLIADGITFSFGVIYVELLKYFGEGKAKTAWIGSLFMAMPLLSGPIASFFTDRYGCRKVTIVGSILAAIGFIISAFTDSIEMLFLTFGIFAGFGLSMCYVAAVVVVAYYFDKKRSFATGLSVCGSGIGTFLFAPITQMLIDEYGWRGTTLILAGMFLNMTVCGALMRDLEWTTYKSKQKAKERRKRNKLGVSADSFSVSNSTNTGTTSNLQKDDANGNEIEHGAHHAADDSMIHRSDSFDDSRLFSSLITLPTFVKNGEKVPVEVLELMASNKHVHSVLLKNYPGLAHSRSFSQPLTSSRHSNGPNLPFDTISPTTVDENGLVRTKSRRIRNEEAFLEWLKHDPNLHHSKNVQMMMNRNPTAYLKNLRMHRRSLTYRGAMLNINRYRLRASSCPDIYRNSMTTIAKEKTQWGQGLDEFKSVLMDMLDFSFFTDIRFTLFAISNFLLYAWYDVPYVYLADNAVEIGFTESDASILISMIGIVNMVGEIILGWFGDRKYLSAGMIYAICMVFCGIVCGLVPLLTSYTGLSVLSGLFGMFIAANYALTSIILVELISLERFTNAYGLLLLVQGIANLIGPPLAGWITDLTGNYDLAFYLAGAFIVVSGVLMMFLPVRGKIKKYRKYRRQGRSSGEESSSEDDADVDIEKCLPPTSTSEKIPKSALRYNGTAINNGDTVNEI